MSERSPTQPLLLRRAEIISVADTVVEQRQERIFIRSTNIDSADDNITEVIRDDEPSTFEVDPSVGGGESDAA